ncbi:MAG: Phage-related minor tail protein [Syntrophaceae bacterium PtaB.Bin095]|nr:MAG: Phage-related minor tail protein [Syntrophaceae bacterium PtaB.Bin095]
MSSVMNLAIQITAVDMLTSVVERVKGSVLSLGKAGDKVKRDFDLMTSGIEKGLKSLAVSAFALQKALPGIKAAGDLQEAMLRVKSNLVSGAKDARDLDRSLRSVKSSAIAIAANAPFSAEQVVNIEGALLKAGVALDKVIGEKGAAWAATALATVSGEAPEMIGDALARIGDMFNFSGDQYGAFSDWVARVDDASASGVPELVYGLKMAGSSAAALRIPVNDTVTAMGVLAPLGERAASSLSNFLIAIASKRNELQKQGIALFDRGRFIGMEKAIDILKKKFGDIKDDQARLAMLMKIFGEEGGRAANQFINAEKGFRELNAEAEKAADLGKKMEIWGEGLNASLAKLAGTAKTTLATLFDPVLGPLRAMLDLLNAATAKLGELGEKSPALSAAVSGGTLAVAGGVGAYGLYSLLRGGAAGARVLKGLGGVKGLLKGFGGTAVGVAEGKAVQAATGVTPVFVTNWPAGGMGGSILETVGAGAAAKGTLGGLAKLAPLLRFLPMLTSPVGIAVGGTAAAAALVVLIKNMMRKTDEAQAQERRYSEMFLQNLKQKNEINLSVQIDQAGRIISKSNDMDTSLNLNTLWRGAF